MALIKELTFVGCTIDIVKSRVPQSPNDPTLHDIWTLSIEDPADHAIYRFHMDSETKGEVVKKLTGVSIAPGAMIIPGAKADRQH